MDAPETSQGLDPHVEASPNGRYIRYSSVLGKGAYKTVYKAFDTEEALEVAWNKLHVDRLNEHDLEKVSNEVSLLRQVEHNNIIHFYDTWRGVDANGTQSINFITEQMMSGTLKEYLKKAKAIKLKVIRRWCRNILEAIAYLHSQDPPIMHRDLKCDNIFINGHVGEVKIGDLGLSGVKEREKADSVIGTPEFMAPELYEESYTEKVDIYAFGMCLLEMVTMEYPYAECNNMAQIFKKVFNGERPKAFETLVQGDVKDVIAACLQREARRPSAVDLLGHPLFSEWDKDDGRISNLSLVKGTKEHQQSSGTTQSSSTMPIGTELIEWSDPLNRNVLVSMLEGEAGAAEDQQVSVVAGRDDDGGGGFYIGLEIPIRDAIKRVEFTFDPFEDNSSHIAQEMVSEFGLGEEQLSVIQAEIDSQVRAAKEQREAASRNATPQPPSRQTNPEGSALIDRGQSLVSPAPNESPPAPAVAPPQLSETVTPPQPELVSPLDPQHHASTDLASAVPPPPPPAAPDHPPNDAASVPAPDQVPLSVSMTSHVSDTNGVAAPAPPPPPPHTDGGVSSHGIAQPQSAENVTVELASERHVHNVATESPQDVNHDHYSAADAPTAAGATEEPRAPLQESNSHPPIIPETPQSHQEVSHKQTLADNVGSDISLATTAPASVEIPTDRQPQRQPETQTGFATTVHVAGSSVELPPSVASTQSNDARIANSMNGNGSLHHHHEPQLAVPLSDAGFVPNGSEAAMPASEAIANNTSHYTTTQEHANAHPSAAEPVVSNNTTQSAEHPLVHNVDYQQHNTAPASHVDGSERNISGHHELPPHHPPAYPSQSVADSLGAHQQHVHHPASTGNISVRPPSAPLTPEPSSFAHVGDEHHHVELPANHSGTTFAEPENMDMNPGIVNPTPHSFVSSESVGEDLLARRTGTPAPKQRPNSTIPVIVVVPNEPSERSNVQHTRSMNEFPRSSGDLDTMSVHSALKATDSVSDTASVRKSVSPDPMKKSTPIREDMARVDRGPREISSPMAARTGSGLSMRSVDGAGNAKEKPSISDTEFDSLCLQLMEFCALGRFDNVKDAIDNGLPATFSDYDKYTPLHVASSYGHTEVCRLLVDKGADVNAKDKWGKTPLSEAQENGHSSVVSLLKGYGAVDETAATNMVSLNLMQFSRKGNAATVRDLLCAGASVSHVDFAGRTALHVACASGHEDVADILLLYGADVEATDKKGQNAVHHAVLNGHRKMLRVLRQYGSVLPRELTSSAPEVARIRGLELIDHSASGDLDGVKFTLDYGADVNFRDYDHRTALHLACAEGWLEVVELLLQNGAETLARDRWDSTPYDEAVKRGFSDIVSELQSVEFQRSQKQSAGRASGPSVGMMNGNNGHRNSDKAQFDQVSRSIAQSISLGVMPSLPSADDFAAKHPSTDKEGRATIGSISSVSLPVTPFDRSGEASNEGEMIEDRLPPHYVSDAMQERKGVQHVYGESNTTRTDAFGGDGEGTNSVTGTFVTVASMAPMAGTENLNCNGTPGGAGEGHGHIRGRGEVKADMQQLVNGLVDAAVSDG